MMQIKDLLKKHGFQFTKRFGQNFISDGNLLDSIVADAGVQKSDGVLEIGCGAGTLTARLAEKANNVIGYEIDTSLKPVIDEYLAEFDNTEIRFCDFLKQDAKSLSEELNDYRVVANLPYYITTPVLMCLLENNIGKSITVMVQKEVAERLVAKEGTKDYGAITVKVALSGEAKINRIVSRNMFFPAPNVDSAVITITRTQVYRGKDEALTEKIVRCAFAMRRKTLINNLTVLGLDKPKLIDSLNKIGLSESCRGETLSPQKFAELSDVLCDFLH